MGARCCDWRTPRPLVPSSNRFDQLDERGARDCQSGLVAVRLNLRRSDAKPERDPGRSDGGVEDKVLGTAMVVYS